MYWKTTEPDADKDFPIITTDGIRYDDKYYTCDNCIYADNYKYDQNKDNPCSSCNSAYVDKSQHTFKPWVSLQDLLKIVKDPEQRTCPRCGGKVVEGDEVHLGYDGYPVCQDCGEC